MGVPAFFRWLTIRYPQVVIDALSEQDLEYYYAEFDKKGDGKEQGNYPAAGRGGEANPYGFGGEKSNGDIDPQILIQRKIEENNPKVDNLYLDMNGIIHPCCHPLDRPQPKTEGEMFGLIFEYMDRVLDIVKPAKTLYLAIDGVAPRAKMNQQRSRRFRTALDAQEKAERTASIKNKWAADGIKFADRPAQGGEQGFDSNVITPGTEFMQNLSKALRLCIVERLHNSDRWQHLKVIFSDASVPGEGEHKILDFIRAQRAQQGYDPNTSHCIHGADADLIMLGLSTHEAHFYILREAVLQAKDKKCRKCHQTGHLTHECGTEATKDPVATRLAQAVQFQFVKLAVVREYLYLEFKDIKLPYAFDFERIVDDFVFLCFFVGNDFLPHLPSLSIREGALDALIFIYKNLLPRLGGYLTRGSGELDFSKVDVLFSDLARVEEDFFRQHQRNATRNEERRKRDEEREKTQHEQQQRTKANKKNQGQTEAGQTKDPVKWRNADKRAPASEEPKAGKETEEAKKTTDEAETAAEELTDFEKNRMTAAQFEQYGKAYVFANIMCKPDLSEEEKLALAAKKLEAIVAKQMREVAEQKVGEYEDKVQFGKEGWKARYYAEKFEVHGEAETKEFCRKIRQAYIEGLAWVFAYYYNGCASWYWYYPYHYAPFASDLLGCDSLSITLEFGEPAKPFEQLLSVFPKQSCHAVPGCYRALYEPGSDILDFYPAEVKLDINGARYAWMGVNLLPFIDRARLQHAAAEADGDGSKLSAQERERNKVCGDVRLFFLEASRNKDTGLQQELLALTSKSKDGKHAASLAWAPLEASFVANDGIEGKVGPLSMPTGQKEREILHGQPVDRSCGSLAFKADSCRAFQVRFLSPKLEKHSPKLLRGVVLPRREVEDFAIYHTNRRVFQGEEAIRIVENVLKIDASQDPVYQFGGRHNRSGQDYGGYRNNRAVYGAENGVSGGGFQALPQLGQRRTFQEYQAGSGGFGGRGYDQQPQKRQQGPNHEGYHRPGGQGYGQGTQQQINYNLRGGAGAERSQGGSGSSIRENYARQMATANQPSDGSNSQLASLLNKFNDVHQRQAQDGGNVLVEAQLAAPQQLEQLRGQAYQQHLGHQASGQQPADRSYSGHGRQGQSNSGYNDRSQSQRGRGGREGGYDERRGYQSGRGRGGYDGGYQQHRGGRGGHNDRNSGRGNGRY